MTTCRTRTPTVEWHQCKLYRLTSPMWHWINGPILLCYLNFPMTYLHKNLYCYTIVAWRCPALQTFFPPVSFVFHIEAMFHISMGSNSSEFHKEHVAKNWCVDLWMHHHRRAAEIMVLTAAVTVKRTTWSSHKTINTNVASIHAYCVDLVKGSCLQIQYRIFFLHIINAKPSVWIFRLPLSITNVLPPQPTTLLNTLLLLGYDHPAATP